MSFRYAISTVKDGNMSYRHGDNKEVLKNREIFFQKYNFDYSQTVCMRTEMKDGIAIVGKEDIGSGMYSLEDPIFCDAMITEDKDINLFLNVADCLPIIIHDPINHVFSIVHGGWPDTDLLICKKVIEKLKSRYNSNPNDLEVIIGPGIHKDSLIYDENILNKITSDWGKYIQEREEGKYHIDNLGYTLQQIEESGVPENNISIIDIDTFKDTNYFSHVRDWKEELEKDRGRFCMICKLI